MSGGGQILNLPAQRNGGKQTVYRTHTRRPKLRAVHKAATASHHPKVDIPQKLRAFALDLTTGCHPPQAVETPSEPMRSTARASHSSQHLRSPAQLIQRQPNTNANDNWHPRCPQSYPGKPRYAKRCPSTRFWHRQQTGTPVNEVRILEDNGDGWSACSS